ncbi:MAG: thioredoxin domain-containing protein [Bifidobacteriaceae bacterium]|jgi:protein-disulfide isomerase|nr:thioredoxin domain-containing protein [Bifidobacteriaceae bacterium]
MPDPLPPAPDAPGAGEPGEPAGAYLPPDPPRTYGPWWQQAGAWIVIGVVVIASAVALVLGWGRGAKPVADAAGSPAAVATVTVTAGAEATEAAAATAGATATAAAELTWDDRELPAVSADCPAAPLVEAELEEGVPRGATEMYGIALGCDGVPGHPVPDGAVEVDVVSDYICPYCQRLEMAQGYNFGVAMREGRIQLVLHPLGYLDGYSTTNYSSRAANAAVTIASLAPEQFWEFNSLLWRNQPAEGGPGLSDEELAQLAAQAGVPQDVIDILPTQPYADWVAEGTAQVSAASDFGGTPWVLMRRAGDEMFYQWYWPNDDFDQSVANVAAGLPPQSE